MQIFKYLSNILKSIFYPKLLTSKLRTNISTDLSTSITRDIVKYNQVDEGKTSTDSKSVEKLLKKSKKFINLKKLYRISVLRNVYSLVVYRPNFNNFLSFFYWA